MDAANFAIELFAMVAKCSLQIAQLDVVYCWGCDEQEKRVVSSAIRVLKRRLPGLKLLGLEHYF